MGKVRNPRFLGLVSVFALAFVFIGFHCLQAQVGTKAKKVKPVEPSCLPVSDPLELSHYGVQIVSGSYVADSKVYLIKYVNGAYENTWTSDPHQGSTYATSIGDVDNDGFKEITTVVNAKNTRGSPSQRYEYQKIFVYEEGSTGEPAYVSPDLGYSLNGVRDSIIADADNDFLSELVLVEDKHIEIYEWTGTGFAHLWSSPDYPYFIWSVDVGDADNDGANEVVLAPFNVGSPIVYEYLGNGEWGEPIFAESMGPFNIDQAKVRDADNDGDNEIVGGGTGNCLVIWEYNATDNTYDIDFLSKDLGGYTQGIDVGNVDGDTENEVIAGTAGDVDKIYVFKYIDTAGTYELIDSISLDAGVNGLATGDLDGDGKDEIAVGSSGISVLEYAPALKELYSLPCAGYIEVD